MKKIFSIGLLSIVILAIFLLSSCFSPAEHTVKLGTSIYDATVNLPTGTATAATVTGVVIGYPARMIDGNHSGGFKALFIEDEKAGVFVVSNSNDLYESYSATPNTYKFNIGDIVTIGGILKNSNGNYKITVRSSANIVKTGDTFDVQPVDLSSASTFSGYDLRLVKISGTVMNLTSDEFVLKTTGSKYISIYDITYGNIVNFHKTLLNDDKVEVTGILALDGSGEYGILPRTADDITKK